MTDAPERIWIRHAVAAASTQPNVAMNMVQYIRADRFEAIYATERAAREQTEAERNAAVADGSILRELLALAYSGFDNLYTDDGELVDNSTHPYIDYGRDSAETLREKIQERGRAKLDALAAHDTGKEAEHG